MCGWDWDGVQEHFCAFLSGILQLELVQDGVSVYSVSQNLHQRTSELPAHLRQVDTQSLSPAFAEP